MTMTAAPESAELLAISKARATNMRDLASDLEVARDAYLSAMESQNADAMAERREVLERMLWDDKGLIIDALRLADKPADEGKPDDIRALGWMVAVHNDYRQLGESHTFWLFTKDGRAIKGEGMSDAEALNKVRAALSTGEPKP